MLDPQDLAQVHPHDLVHLGRQQQQAEPRALPLVRDMQERPVRVVVDRPDDAHFLQPAHSIT